MISYNASKESWTEAALAVETVAALAVDTIAETGSMAAGPDSIVEMDLLAASDSMAVFVGSRLIDYSWEMAVDPVVTDQMIAARLVVADSNYISPTFL